MAYVIADNIISPLGKTSEENYLSVKAGKSMLHAYEPGSYGVQDGFCASLIDAADATDAVSEKYAALENDKVSATDAASETILKTSFERLAFASARQAILQSGIDVSRHRVLFILSTTKGAIEELGKMEDEDIYLGAIAQRIATALGIKTKPIVICNACISGLSALILATRLLEAKRSFVEPTAFEACCDSSVSYDYAVVCGADNPRRFIISGFQSLKALSTEPCRPFDMERFGLNLGEAAATIVLGKYPVNSKKNADTQSLEQLELSSSKNVWQIGHGYIKNDAFHISAPSKTSEGLYACLRETLQGLKTEDIGFINAHGTATLFNDQMESIAIQRAGLSQVPVDALKGYFCHTLGAAGILETILCMKAADDHIIIGTRGFEELGVSGKMNISPENRSTDKPTFVKMLSGFGGCNATLLATKERAVLANERNCVPLIRRHHVRITPKGVTIDGNRLEIKEKTEDSSMLTAIYKQYIGGYPKYYKMDGLSRLGFVASELLLKAEADSLSNQQNVIVQTQLPLGVPADLQSAGKQGVSKNENLQHAPREKLLHEFDRAVILFNRSSSIASDKKFLASIADKDNYFPSPSIFVYTLPNIVTGEIAIRNGYHGETSFYVLADKDEAQMQEILQTVFMDAQTKSAIAGWLDYEDATHFEADLFIVERAKAL